MPQEGKRTIDYWRVMIVYLNGETSANRIFRDRKGAAAWPADKKSRRS